MCLRKVSRLFSIYQMTIFFLQRIFFYFVIKPEFKWIKEQ